MTEYATQTVAQLKEILKEKGLSVEGKKADLVQRLNDATSSGEAKTEDVAEGENVVAPAEAAAETSETVADAGEAATEAAPTSEAVTEGTGESTLTIIQPTPKEEPKILSPEERKQLAVELLKKKVSRAEKFGDDVAAEAARKDLARVEKFGVELGTSLAREIGLVDKSLGNGGKKFGKKRGFKGRR